MLRFEKFVALRYLRSPRQEGFISVITWFSFIGIALGVATLIIVMSVMNGFREELLNSIIGMKGHIFVTKNQERILVSNQIPKQIERTPNVAYALELIEQQALCFAHGHARGVMIHALSKSDFQKQHMLSSSIKSGTIDSFEGDVVFVGNRLAELMQLKIGNRLVLMSPDGNATAFGNLPRQKSYRIAGVFEVGMNEFDKNFIIMPLESAQKFFKMDGKASHLEIFVRDISKTSQTVKQIKQTLGDSYHIVDWKHSDASIFHAVEVERNVMFLILTLIIVIASFNIISGLIMLVKDKTRDIAILRTFGAQKKSIMWIFFITGSTIGVVGTLLGLILGLSFAYNIETIRKWLESLLGTNLFNAEIYFLSQLPAKLDITQVTWIALMSLCLSFLATFYPSWKASKLNPVEALRF